jgi:hypothetical protein
MANLRDLSNVACIVGGDESDEMATLPHKSQLSLHVEAVTNAVRDAGLKISETRSLWPPNMQPHSRAHENAESKPKDLGDLLVVAITPSRWGNESFRAPERDFVQRCS